MIEVKTGSYRCNVLNCGDGKCVHEWINHFCPHCSSQLVHVKTNGVVFCSNHELICDYDSKLKNKDEFHTIDDVLELRMKELLQEEKDTMKKLDDIRAEIKDTAKALVAPEST